MKTNEKFKELTSNDSHYKEEFVPKIQYSMTNRALKGKWNGGVVLGYKSVNKELFIEPYEAEIVRDIFQKYAIDNWGLKKIANHLNEGGHKTKKGNDFSVTALSNILKNPVYKGYIRFNQVVNWNQKRRTEQEPHEVVLVKGSHVPIIAKDIWELAQKKSKAKNSDKMLRTRKGNFPLSGLLKCPDCQSSMTSMLGSKKRNGEKYRYYTCTSYHNKGRAVCNPNLINGDLPEEEVFRCLTKEMQNSFFKKDMVNVLLERVVLQPKEATLLSEMKQLGSDSQSSTARLEELNKRQIEVSNRMSVLKEGVEEFLDEVASFQEIRESLSPEECCDLLKGLIKSIEIENKHIKTISFHQFD